MKAGIAAAALAVVCLLVGCEKAVPPPAPAPPEPAPVVAQPVAEAPKPIRPTDADFVTRDGVALGMTYDEVLAILGTPDDELESKGHRYLEKDGVSYGFLEDGAVLHVADFATEQNENGVMPLGISVGAPIGEIVARLECDAAFVWAAGSDMQLYGQTRAPMSADLLSTEDGYHLRIFSEYNCMNVFFNQNDEVVSINCLAGETHPLELLFATDPKFYDATVLDVVAAEDAAYQLTGAVLYTRPNDGQSFGVAFATGGYSSYLHSMGVGLCADGAALGYQPGTFHYEGNGKVSLTAHNPTTDAREDFFVTYATDGEGNSEFVLDSRPHVE